MKQVIYFLFTVLATNFGFSQTEPSFKLNLNPLYSTLPNREPFNSDTLKKTKDLEKTNKTTKKNYSMSIFVPDSKDKMPNFYKDDSTTSNMIIFDGE